jgi:diguanylate cyclase (GGDEF)-like protein
MDLDGFKPINDTHGHEIGDKVLKAVAQRIKSTARQGDFVARLGGDEFVLLVDNIDNASELGPVFSRLIRTISEPIGVGDLVVSVGLSIGASIFPRDGISAEMLLAHADQAMYHAKKAGGRQSALWEGNVQLDQTEP